MVARIQAEHAEIRQAQKVERDRLDAMWKRCQQLEAGNLEIIINPNFLRDVQRNYVERALGRMTSENLSALSIFIGMRSVRVAGVDHEQAESSALVLTKK